LDEIQHGEAQKEYHHEADEELKETAIKGVDHEEYVSYIP